MDRLDSRTFLCCLLFLVFTGAKSQQFYCWDGWFGDKCQYQCHCLPYGICDKTTGDCLGECDRGWFGPQCQYMDAAYSNNSYLTDGIESTCLIGSALYQYFPMLDDVMFTWMRIVTNKAGLFDRMNMTFLSSSGETIVQKSPLTKIFVSDTILALYGELQGRFKTIRLDFDTDSTRRSFCTMQVSAGRNVAIKQNASQSSTWSNAEKGVDGKTTQKWNESSCSSTDQEDSPYWTLNLSQPITVNMYTLIGATDLWVHCRLRYFRLESYYKSTKVQQYDETDTVDKVIHDVYPPDTSPITSVTLTVSRERWPDNYIDCDRNRLSLSFCEMQIFGDVVCPPGKWGRDCEKDCNCQDLSESCFVSTGTCTSGCRAGFQGPGCQQECDARFFGEDCATRCSDKCIDTLCHHITGVCDECPVGKRISKDCSGDCNPGFFGPRCTNQCSEHCGGDGFCNNINGRCISGCKPGYTSDTCEQPCAHTTYGEDCNKTCSVNCVVNATQEPAVCKHVNGQCLLGCVSGYSGITCEEIPSDDLNPVIIVVPIILVLMAIAALITGVCLWRRRKAQQTDGSPVVNTGKEIGPDVAHERGVRLEMKNQQSREQDTVDQNYENMNPYEIEDDPGLKVYDKISPSMKQKDNPPFNEFEKTGVNRDSTSNVYKEPEEDD